MPARLVALVYIAAGILWIFGSGPVADLFADATSISRWAIEFGKGVLFVVVTAMVLYDVLRRRADHLNDADALIDDKGRQLDASEDRNHLQESALSGTPTAMMITDGEGTIEWVNSAFETMSGFAASDVVGGTPSIFESGAHDTDFYRDLWETVSDGEVWSGQMVNRRSDGELYTINQTITPVIAHGEIHHYVATHEDLTEHVEVARELEASRQQLKSLFDHALDAIVLADDEGRYIEVNPAACKLTGYSRDELLGMHASDLATPDQQPAAVYSQFSSFVETGAESGTFTLRHKDGRSVETEYRAVSNIQPGVHLSVLRDVTARDTMLRALILAEAEFRGLAENAEDIVTKLHIGEDDNLRVDYINPAATTILGYPREHLYANANLLADLFYQRPDHHETVLDLLPTPSDPIRLATVQVQHAEGRPIWLEVHSSLTDPAGCPATIQVVARDVTARSEMTQALEQALEDQVAASEQLRTLNTMKDTFLQSVSHELRTPLTAILGFAHLLADTRHGLSPTATRTLPVRILAQAQRLQQLLDDLLDIDRFTRGTLDLQRVETDVGAVVEQALSDVELGAHTVEVDLEPVTMKLDGPWVERIIVNLLRNAVRHTPDDSRIWVSVRATPEGVALTFDDDGPGIPEADRQRVIEPFEQGRDAASAAQPGTGIGLSLVDTFAQLHGGALTLGASPAGGVRAVVTLAHEQGDQLGP